MTDSIYTFSEATFRIDKVGSVAFKWLSIREIDPSKKLVESDSSHPKNSHHFSFNQILLTIIKKPNEIHYVLAIIN